MMRWSTPLPDHRQFGTNRLMARGEARGVDSHLRFDLDEIEYNVAAPG